MWFWNSSSHFVNDNLKTPVVKKLLVILLCMVYSPWVAAARPASYRRTGRLQVSRAEWKNNLVQYSITERWVPHLRRWSGLPKCRLLYLSSLTEVITGADKPVQNFAYQLWSKNLARNDPCIVNLAGDLLPDGHLPTTIPLQTPLAIPLLSELLPWSAFGKYSGRTIPAARPATWTPMLPTMPDIPALIRLP